MVSLGRLLVRGLGAGMEGVGKTLLEQDADAKKKEMDNALLLRQEALARFDHGLAIDTLAATSAAQVGTHQAESDIDTASLAKRLPGQVAAKIAEINATQRAEYEKEYNLLTAKQKGDMTLAQYVQAQETARNAATNTASITRANIEGQTVRATHPIISSVAPDGTPVATMAGPGNSLRTIKVLGAQTIPLARQDLADQDRADTAGGVASYRQPTGGGGTGATGAATGTATAAGTATPDYSTYQQMITEAAHHTDFQGMTPSQMQSRVAALARSQGIAVPPDVQ